MLVEMVSGEIVEKVVRLIALFLKVGKRKINWPMSVENSSPPTLEWECDSSHSDKTRGQYEANSKTQNEKNQHTMSVNCKNNR